MSLMPLFMMTPSTTISGERLRFNDLAPRRMIDGEVPGRPLGVTICAPTTLPWRADSALVATTGMFAASTLSTVKASFLVSVAPVTPVTTTSDRRLMSTASVKSCVWLPALMVRAFVCGRNPIARTTRFTVCPRMRSELSVMR